MEFDFDRLVDRRGTSDIKWNHEAQSKRFGVELREDFIPLWVADMDFATAPCITKAIENRAANGIYGYCSPKKSYFDAVSYWFEARYGWKLEAEWVNPIPSVICAINVAIRAFSNPGDGVIIQQPVYDPFAEQIERTKRTLANNALILEDGEYRMDYELLEKQAAEPKNKVMVLCSPHNPIGRVWRREELERVNEICRRNNVLVVSDEIHSDIVYAGHSHTPYPLLNEETLANSILCSSPAKTFNIPGLKMANTIIPNPELRARFAEEQLALSLDIKHVFGIEAVTAAYSPEGKAWLEALIPYLEENAALVAKTANEQWEGVSCKKPHGSFVCWLDFRQSGYTEDEVLNRLAREAGVICTKGSWFGEGGKDFIRMNIACPRPQLKEALGRIEKTLFKK